MASERRKEKVRLVRQVDAIIADCQQQLRDIRFWNEAHPDETPIDAGNTITLIATAKAQRAAMIREDADASERLSGRMVEIADAGSEAMEGDDC